MGSIIENIGLAVTSSFLTLIILGIFNFTWRKWIEDFWMKIAFRHVIDIDGVWCSQQDCKIGTSIEKITLSQKGWKVSGISSYELKEGDKVTKREKFQLEGIFRGDILSLYYANVDRTKRGAGSITLSLQNDASEFTGFTIVYDTNNSVLKAIPITYTRERQAVA